MNDAPILGEHCPACGGAVHIECIGWRPGSPTDRELIDQLYECPWCRTWVQLRVPGHIAWATRAGGRGSASGGRRGMDKRAR